MCCLVISTDNSFYASVLHPHAIQHLNASLKQLLTNNYVQSNTGNNSPPLNQNCIYE